MRKLKLLLLCTVLLLTLAACGGETEQSDIPEEEEVQESLPPVEETPEEELPAEEIPEKKPEQEESPAEEKPAANSGDSGRGKIPEPKKTYFFRINLATCTVNIYTKDEIGEFTVPYRVMLCSTGRSTPKSGIYRIGNIWEWLRLKDNVYGHYVVQITGNILFHSVPYLRWGDPGSLEYWEFDKLGEPASLGCIRLQVSDAIWVYHNGRDIAGVEFYSDDDPGPFGKPTAPKISDNVLCRDWDPTDPDPANPWHSYVPEEQPEEGAVSNPDGETAETPEGGTAPEGTTPEGTTPDTGGTPEDGTVTEPETDGTEPAPENPEGDPAEETPSEEAPPEGTPPQGEGTSENETEELPAA